MHLQLIISVYSWIDSSLTSRKNQAPTWIQPRNGDEISSGAQPPAETPAPFRVLGPSYSRMTLGEPINNFSVSTLAKDPIVWYVDYRDCRFLTRVMAWWRLDAHAHEDRHRAKQSFRDRNSAAPQISFEAAIKKLSHCRIQSKGSINRGEAQIREETERFLCDLNTVLVGKGQEMRTSLSPGRNVGWL